MDFIYQKSLVAGVSIMCYLFTNNSYAGTRSDDLFEFLSFLLINEL